VDLKFFREDSYKRICSGSLKPVEDTIRLMHEMGVWVEITTLIVPKENDTDEQLKGIAGFISGIDKLMPWHISRFHPDYKFGSYDFTPENVLAKAEKFGREAGLKNIYIGNVAGLGNDTYCPKCRKLIVKREDFSVLEQNIKDGKCAYCQEKIAGVF
jgi:pyruvate formate lyase activating enzyme